jgi:hypothetical protein
VAIRNHEAMGFTDAVLAGRPRSAALLERLDAATPWRALAAPIYAMPEYANTGPGRPAWDPILMLKCLLLAKWNNLSDPQLEEQLQDRISVRRLVGLSFTDATPDETTFVRFRTRLREARLHDHIFDAVVRHPLGMLKQQVGFRKVRYRGRAHNEFDFALTLIACNLKRSLSLMQEDPSPGLTAARPRAPPREDRGDPMRPQTRRVG